MKATPSIALKRLLPRFGHSIRKIALLGCGLILSAPLMAQFDDEPVESVGKAKVSGFYGYFTPGYTQLEMGPLNTSLAATGISGYSNDNFTLGGGGFVMARNFIIGGEGQGLITQKQASPTQESEYSVGWGALNLGYVVYSHRGMILYPRLGIGSYTQRFQIADANPDQNFGQAVGADYTGMEMTREGWLLSADLGFEFMPGFDESAGAGLVIGLDVGYQLALSAGEWEAYGHTVAGGPDLDMSGFFVRLHIGGGGWHRQ